MSRPYKVLYFFYFSQAYDSSSEVLLREVIHYHFTSWPDHGVPSQILPFLSMVKQISKDFKKGKNKFYGKMLIISYTIFPKSKVI